MKVKLSMRRKILVSALMVLFIVSIIPVIEGLEETGEEVDLTVIVVEPEPEPEPEPEYGPVYVGRPNKSPVADAGPNQKSWTNMTVYFNGSKSEDPDGTIESYEWDFGDGEGASGVAVEHDYLEPGQYTVTLTVRDNRWSYDSDTCKVKLSDPPAPVSNQFVERVHKREHFVDAMDDANTTVTLNTTDQVTVMVLRYEDNPHPEDPLPATALPFYVDVEVSDPDAVVWPIYVEMFYTDEEVEGLDESTFGIYYWMDGAWQRCSDTGVDTERNVVWAYMTAEEAAGSPIVIAGMRAITPPPLPPFIDTLVITPEEIELGDNVTISVDIMNPNDGAISYGFEMQIGLLNFPFDVDLEANESKTVSRTIFPTAVGTYNVTVAGMTESFKVKAPPLPAEFVISDLSITPKEAETLEEVEISFTVTNVGEETGNYTFFLLIEGPFAAGSVEMDGVLDAGEYETAEYKLTLETPGNYTVEIDELTGSFTVKAPPTPADFVFSNLQITPDEEITPGEYLNITISVNATNKGEETGDYTVNLKLNGTVIDSNEVTLTGGASITTFFKVTKGNGFYTVEVEGLPGSFTIDLAEETPFWLGPGYVAGIMIVVVSAGAIIYLLWKGRFPSIYTPRA